MNNKKWEVAVMLGNISKQEILRRIEDHFKDLTEEQLVKNLEDAGYFTYKHSYATIFSKNFILYPRKEKIITSDGDLPVEYSKQFIGDGNNTFSYALSA